MQNAPRSRTDGPGAADGWSVDVDERKPVDPPPDPRPLAAAAANLSPVQQAYGRWVRHCLACACCRDVDCGRCGAADRLWQVYQAQTDEAYRRLGGGTA